jgi:adenylate cyclase
VPERARRRPRLVEVLNTGLLVAGNVGGGGRQSYTVHGDTVNLAARLEALCKELGTSLLLSAATGKALPGEQLVPVGTISVRGLSEPVALYSIR